MGKPIETVGIQGKRSKYANEKYIDKALYETLVSEHPELIAKNLNTKGGISRARNIARVLSDNRISQPNRKLILEYIRERQIEGLAFGSVYNYAFNLKSLAIKLRKAFREMTEEDLKRYFASRNDIASMEWKICIKRFFQWLYGLKEKNYPKQIAWLKLKFSKKRKLPEEMLSQEDILKLAGASTNYRDKAVIMVLYDTGMRAGELLALKVKHFQPDEYGGCLLIPSGKTGSRKVRLTICLPDFRNWLNNHPSKNKPESALFPSLLDGYSHLSGTNHIDFILKKSARLCGLKKKVYPHLFRHSRATDLASKHTEQELKMLFGWTASSQMASNYVHMSFNALDRKRLENEGMLKPEDKLKETSIKPKICGRCGTPNSILDEYCSNCSFFLDSEKELIKMITQAVAKQSPEASAIGKTALERGNASFTQDGKRYKVILIQE